jgi:5-bromo-4-chloroindolyl phosphate hydrolysis protein
MTVMNITNRDEMQPILSQIDPNVRTFPSAVLMYISMKFFVFLALNMVLIISIVPCVWDSINENKRTKMKSDRVYILSSSLTGNEDRELDM